MNTPSNTHSSTHRFHESATAQVQGRASYIDGYGLTNARVGLRNGNNHWDVSLWARNLFDVDYVASVHPLYGVGDYGAFAGDPLTYGVTLRANLY